MCPRPDSKKKEADDYVKSKGVLGYKYSSNLHYAIASLCSADRALPAHSSGVDGALPALERRRLICSTHSVDVFPVQFGIAFTCCNGRSSNNSSARTSQCTVGGFTKCGFTLLGLS